MGTWASPHPCFFTCLLRMPQAKRHLCLRETNLCLRKAYLRLRETYLRLEDISLSGRDKSLCERDISQGKLIWLAWPGWHGLAWLLGKTFEKTPKTNSKGQGQKHSKTIWKTKQTNKNIYFREIGQYRVGAGSVGWSP